MQTSTDFTKLVNLKNIMRILSIILIICFFVPSFVVSCSGADIKLSAAKVMVGTKYQGQTVVGANPICIIFLLLPIAMLVLWCLKSVLKDKIAALACGCCAAADLIFWIIFRVAVASRAEQAYCESKAAAGFVLNIIFLLVMVTINLLVFLNVIEAETPLIHASVQPQNNAGQQPYQAQPTNQQPANQQLYQAQPVTPQPASTPAGAGFCENCGAPLVAGNKFCTKCGNKVE